MLALSAEQQQLVQNVLRQHLPQTEVRAFGSRVTGPVKPHSDLDLVIVALTAVPLSTMAQLKEAFADSDLPFRVDLHDWTYLSEEFRSIIEQNYQAIQSAHAKT